MTEATLNVPPGTYILDGKAEFYTATGAVGGGGCWFSPPGLGVSDQSDVDVPLIHTATLSVHEAQSFASSTTIDLVCGVGGSQNPITTDVSQVVLRATLVGGIN